jgi:hypothetical protein
MTSDEVSLGELTQEVVAIHKTLDGISPSTAELHYLNEARQLDSFGTEFYPTKVWHHYIVSCIDEALKGDGRSSCCVWLLC